MGFGICCRLIDEFLQTRPQSDTLYLLFSTRDIKKSDDTLRRLNAHFQQTLKSANGRTPGASLLLEPRVKLEGVQVDLTKLITVKALAQQLLKRRQKIDGVVWNAGLAGWLGLNWFRAIRDVLTRPIEATTYPEFMKCDVGALAPRQLAGYGKVHTFEEPRLGQVFTANVFGHYMLTHWLGPLMGPESRVVWIGSVSSFREYFEVEDIQGFTALKAYEGSKRLTELLVISSELPSTKPYTDSFLPSARSRNSSPAITKPKMYITHPGVVATSISGLNAFIAIFMTIALYLARLIGSPWHPITPYKGAISAVYALISPDSQLPALEESDGKAKWGSACSVFGEERVARTEVDQWGYTGVVGATKPSDAVRAKWPSYKGSATKEDREDFETTAQNVWSQMETLRKDWEVRLGKVEVDDSAAADV